MDDLELDLYIRKCASKNINSPVNISESSELFLLALNLLINKSKNNIRMIINFHKGQASQTIFDSLNEDVVINNVVDFLKMKNSKIHILTNEQKRVRDSVFFKKTSEFSSQIKLRAIPPKIYEEISNKGLDLLIADENSVIVGACYYQPNYYVNFGDESAYEKLNSYFNRLKTAVDALGGAKYD
ncbi:hypothetical protein [Shewanella mangrovisoli]|uniref:hypothetical protein n=1 Tax=Shewanella mangrovisoli TaxID=2864211 RepID=UPI001C65CB87|nr:hypothetical protein [Shewanella mangrovisoli]QYK07846.1 hypothetical protein K0H60_13570 [Shewanella mangrovisoli]